MLIDTISFFLIYTFLCVYHLPVYLVAFCPILDLWFAIDLEC